MNRKIPNLYGTLKSIWKDFKHEYDDRYADGIESIIYHLIPALIEALESEYPTEQLQPGGN